MSKIYMGLNDAWKDQGFARFLDWFFKAWIDRGGPKTGKSQMFELLERAGFTE